MAGIGDESEACPGHTSSPAPSTDSGARCEDQVRCGEQRSVKLSNYCLIVQFTNCSALAETSCWHAKVRTACPRSCGQCPGQQPAPSTTCYNQSVMRNKKLDTTVILLGTTTAGSWRGRSWGCAATRG